MPGKEKPRAFLKKIGKNCPYAALNATLNTRNVHGFDEGFVVLLDLTKNCRRGERIRGGKGVGDGSLRRIFVRSTVENTHFFRF